MGAQEQAEATDRIDAPLAVVIGKELIEDRDKLVKKANELAVTNEGSLALAGDFKKAITGMLKTIEDERKRRKAPVLVISQTIDNDAKALSKPLTEAKDALLERMDAWAKAEEKRRQEEARKQREAEEAAAQKLAEEAERQAQEARERQQEAERAAKAAADDGDTAEMEKAREIASQAALEANQYEQHADETLERAVAMPEVDHKVSKVRGAHGSTVGMRDNWKCELVDLHALAKEAPTYLTAIQNDEKCKKAIESLLGKIAIAMAKGNGEQIPGLKAWNDRKVAVR